VDLAKVEILKDIYGVKNLNEFNRKNEFNLIISPEIMGDMRLLPILTASRKK